MPSSAFSGVGTQFKRSNMASSPSYTAIAEVNNIDGPNMSRDTIDVTNLDSTGGYREFIGGFRDGGEVNLEMNFTLAGYDQMKDDFESDALVDYQIVLPDTGATTLQFSAFVTSLGVSVPTDDKVTASVTFKISGAMTLDT